MNWRAVVIPLVSVLTLSACRGGEPAPPVAEAPTTTTAAPPEVAGTTGTDTEAPATTDPVTPAPPTTGNGGTATTTAPTAPATTVAAPPATGPAPVTTATTGPPAAIPVGPAPLADVRLRLTRLVDLDQPLDLAQRAGDDALYVAEKGGGVRVVRGGAVTGTALDLSGEVSGGGEQGLLGIAFSADGTRFYASYTNRAGHSRLSEYAFSDGRADPATKRDLFALNQPFPNHNGGQVTFGPDGLLYWFLGDGGAANDPAGNAQNLSTLLGKILRIDPTPSPSGPYTVPADNPFVGRSGALPEIYAYGLRNPWRNSFDRETGDLWIGDVGQSAREEINYTPRSEARGANFGWAAREGTRPGPRPIPPAEGAVDPVHEYPTSDGCAVTGGYVYRGSRIPALAGAYLFGDFCNGRIQGLRLTDGRLAEHRDLGIQVPQLASFGEDAAGELYALSLAGGLFLIEPA